MKKERALVLLIAMASMTATAFGVAILAPGDPIIAIDETGIITNSSYPGGEAPPLCLDGDPGTKYLYFGGLCRDFTNLC